MTRVPIRAVPRAVIARMKAEREAKRLKKRVRNCDGRSLTLKRQSASRHMKTKHPGFSPEEEA